MAETESNTEVKPEVISKEEADRLDNYAQGLNDKVTKVVDYGSIGEEKSKKK